ncbi:MAG TPA: hypothetical protein VK458_01530 [Myxococcaceae bacterium]|nr:hypothetical protein [Myxococcaceae bacterium]
MVRRLVMLTLLLTVQTGCPHAWGRQGTIEKALKRDMDAYYSLRDCALEKLEWDDLCATFHERKDNPAAQQACPLECRPPPPGMP